MEASKGLGRHFRTRQRAASSIVALAIVVGVIVAGLVLLFAAAYILVIGLLIIGGLVMLLGPKPYGIWVGLALVLLAFLSFLAAQNNVLHLAIAGTNQL